MKKYGITFSITVICIVFPVFFLLCHCLTCISTGKLIHIKLRAPCWPGPSLEPRKVLAASQSNRFCKILKVRFFFCITFFRTNSQICIAFTCHKTWILPLLLWLWGSDRKIFKITHMKMPFKSPGF